MLFSSLQVYSYESFYIIEPRITLLFNFNY